MNIISHNIIYIVKSNYAVYKVVRKVVYKEEISR